MTDDITERVLRVITKTQHLPEGKATAGSSFLDLGIDSLDGINIVFALENEFDVSIPDEDMKTIRGVPDVVDGIRKLMAAKAADA